LDLGFISGAPLINSSTSEKERKVVECDDAMKAKTPKPRAMPTKAKIEAADSTVSSTFQQACSYLI